MVAGIDVAAEVNSSGAAMSMAVVEVGVSYGAAMLPCGRWATDDTTRAGVSVVHAWATGKG